MIGDSFKKKSTAMKVGDILKFRFPFNEEEASETFTVLEDRTDRVLVEFTCQNGLKPTFVFLKLDLVKI